MMNLISMPMKGQSWQGAKRSMVLRPKSQGRRLMVSDFVDDLHGGLNPEKQEVAKLSQPDLPTADCKK